VLRWHLEREGLKIGEDAPLEAIVLAQRERSKTVREMAQSSRFFFERPSAYDEKAVRKHVNAGVLAAVGKLVSQLAVTPSWNAPYIHEVINTVCAAEGLTFGKIAQPIRIAVCGGTISPPIDATLAILGRQESLARLEAATQAWAA
jgi:glutamyl-tRNA synthetase